MGVRRPPQSLPRILCPEDIVVVATRQVDEERTLIDKIVQNVSKSEALFENVVLPLAELENSHAGDRAVMNVLKYCSPAPECQQAIAEAEKIFHHYGSVVRRDLYELLHAVRQRNEALDVESQKLLDQMLLEFDEDGYGVLRGVELESFLKTKEETNQLRIAIQRNIRQHSGGERFTPDELDGVPRRVRDPSGVGPDGKEFINNSGAYLTVMKHAKNAETRKRMMLSRSQRSAQNGALFREVILLRDQNARALGYRSHAETRIPRRIAPSVAWVHEFLDTLAKALLPIAQREFEILETKKQHHCSDKTAILEAWDILFYRQLISNENEIDEEAISEYFPLQHALGAVMDLFADFLQLRFERLHPNEIEDFIWHESVQVWAVWDEGPRSTRDFLGYICTDLIPRPNKFKGGGSATLWRGYEKADGSREYPTNVIIGNFEGFSPTTGHLMTHANLKTLFHELGHGIHDLIGRTKYARFNGYRTVPEITEGIGVMLEQWLWLKSELKLLSCHYTVADPKYRDSWRKEHPECEDPPREIPDTLLENLIKQRPRTNLHQCLNTMATALFDMAVHDPPSRDALLQSSNADVYNDIFEKLQFYRFPDPHHRYIDSTHLVSGYDAGYYSYMCAEVFAADLFESNFKQDPRCKDAWNRFRKGMLDFGGSRDELEMLEEFLGRPASPDALISMLTS